MSLKRLVFLCRSGGVRLIWLRNDLNNISKRLKALAAKMAQDGIVVTETQLQVLERSVVMKQKLMEKLRRSIQGISRMSGYVVLCR